PAVAVADRREAGFELRVAGVALIADALIVRAWNLQNIESEVAGVEIGAEHFLLLPREAERTVHQQRRAESPGLPGCQLPDFCIPAVSGRVRIGPEIVRQVIDDRAH